MRSVGFGDMADPTHDHALPSGGEGLERSHGYCAAIRDAHTPSFVATPPFEHPLLHVRSQGRSIRPLERRQDSETERGRRLVVKAYDRAGTEDGSRRMRFLK